MAEVSTETIIEEINTETTILEMVKVSIETTIKAILNL